MKGLDVSCKRCEHGRVKDCCIICSQQFFCEHSKRKMFARSVTEGCSICQHGKRMIYCKDCHGSAICVHLNVKYMCKECKGSRMCQHGRRKYICKDCKGSYMFEHERQKYDCIKCSPHLFCVHEKDVVNAKIVSLRTANFLPKQLSRDFVKRRRSLMNKKCVSTQTLIGNFFLPQLTYSHLMLIKKQMSSLKMKMILTRLVS